jgi:hypothetical protein
VSKFNTPRSGTITGRMPTSPVTASATPNATTYEGGPGHTRDVKSELFQLAVVNMVSEKTFYEDAQSRDSRYAQLVRQATIEDHDWTARMLHWLRTTANMRSAALVGAAEYTRARLDAGLAGTSRGVVASVLQRADEPGELLAYWTSRYGKNIPKPIKRGVADAATRLYTEYSLLKYDTTSHSWRFADVIDLTHPSPKAPWQDALFRHALDRRHGRDTPGEVLDSLPIITANLRLRGRVADGDYGRLLEPDALHDAGMTWEDALSLAGSNVRKAQLWDALIPTMGYMALLRNLRNFDEVGISPASVKHVTARLMNPEQVAKSRQFPYRFLSAYVAAPSDRWKQPLNDALAYSMANIPELPGRTLVLVDTSGSMTGMGLSARSKISPLHAASLLGVALTHRNTAPNGHGQVDLHGFASGVFRHEISRGASVLHEVNRFIARAGEVGHGTDMLGALKRTYNGHDRVFLISDMQTVAASYGTVRNRLGDVVSSRQSAPADEILPRHVPLYGFNLGGYDTTAYPAGSPNRHEFGGLNDATLRAIPLLEAGNDAGWPF